MRKITVDSVKFMNINFYKEKFQDMNPDSKALFLTLFLLERKDNIFELKDLENLTFNLGYKKTALKTLVKNNFFVELPNGDLRLVDYNSRFVGVI